MTSGYVGASLAEFIQSCRVQHGTLLEILDTYVVCHKSARIEPFMLFSKPSRCWD